MASAAQSLRFAAKSCKPRRLNNSRPYRLIAEQRTFSTTSPSRALEETDEVEFDSRDQALRRLVNQVPPIEFGKPGFQNMGEKKAGMGMILEDDDFEDDEISSLAHGQLDEHRERRQYLRIAAWEMPLLSEMAKPFVPPTSRQPLRFRYTSYLGENHPAEKKVVLEFCPGDMPHLTVLQRMKLVKLLGPRYNPETQIAKMSSDSFDNQAQNKRYLGDLVDTLLEEARDPTDTFEDVPLDTRHHVVKVKPRFPKKWRMDQQRQAALNDARQKVLMLEAEKAQTGALVDGLRAIEQSFEMQNLKEAMPQLITVGGSNANKKGKIPKRTIR